MFDVFNCLHHEPTGQEKDIRRFVIVDDTLTTGTTVAAIVNLLREHGLTNDCEVIVACDEAKSADALQGFLATFWPGRCLRVV